jgi:hypothetical protein
VAPGGRGASATTVSDCCGRQIAHPYSSRGSGGALRDKDGQDAGAFIVAGLPAQRRCVRPEERVPGAWVPGQFMLDTCFVQGGVDLLPCPAALIKVCSSSTR